MKEILRPKSNLEGPKSRLPIGQEPKIEASDWSRADDFKKFKPKAFRQKIPVTPLILASFRRFRSHS